MSTTTSTTTKMTMKGDETQDYKKGEHYVEFDNPIEEMPPVVVFFSLIDPTSRQWAEEKQIVQTIRRHVPNGTEVLRYHSSDPWSKDLGEDLTQSWAVASSLQLDDQVLSPLFEVFQGEAKATDIAGVKAAFDSVGIPPLRFDRELAKPSVAVEAKWMDECRRRLNIKTIPSLVVSGRYLLKPEAFGTDLNADMVADVVKELLELKH